MIIKNAKLVWNLKQFNDLNFKMSNIWNVQLFDFMLYKNVELNLKFRWRNKFLYLTIWIDIVKKYLNFKEV